MGKLKRVVEMIPGYQLIIMVNMIRADHFQHCLAGWFSRH